jgi:hypothetical protein
MKCGGNGRLKEGKCYSCKYTSMMIDGFVGKAKKKGKGKRLCGLTH